MTSPYGTPDGTSGETTRMLAKRCHDLAVRKTQETRHTPPIWLIPPAKPVRESAMPSADQLDEDFEGFATDTAAAAMPPVRDVLTLKEYAPDIDVMRIFDGKMGSVLGDHVWCEEAYFEQALKWLRGLDAGLRKSIPNVLDLFEYKITDIFHLDRAIRAVHDTGAPEPIKEDGIPANIPDPQNPRMSYHLERVDLYYSDTTPSRVLDATSEFLQLASPDRLWIARYVQPSRSYDPIIFAEFGKWEHVSWSIKNIAWQIEVVRWG
jgi:hypothetical protein